MSSHEEGLTLVVIAERLGCKPDALKVCEAITRLTERVKELEGALKPFADFAEKAETFVAERAKDGGSPILPVNDFRLSHFRRAAAALKSHAGEGAVPAGEEAKPPVDVVRALARVICKSRTCRGADCCQWPANMGERHKCPVDRGNYDDAARDVLAASSLLSKSAEVEWMKEAANEIANLIDEAMGFSPQATNFFRNSVCEEFASIIARHAPARLASSTTPTEG